MKNWHENDQFWEKMRGKLFGDEQWKTAEKEVEQLISLLNLKTGDTLLDMCCGPGRHSLEFASRGFDVTGVDRTEHYLENARAKAKERNLEIELVHDDARIFERDKSFNAAVLMYTSLGYFENQDENLKVLCNICNSLNAGGKLVVDVMGKEIIARIFRERNWFEMSGIFFLEERKVSKNWSWMESRWIMIKDKERHEFTLSHWMYSASELSEMLKQAGFKSVDIFGNLEQATYDHTAQRLITVATK